MDSTGEADEKKKIIGLVLDFFNADILAGAHAYAEEQGLILDARWSVRGDWTPKDPKWDGVIYSVVDDPKLKKRIERWKIPKVSVSDENAACSVTPNYMQCGKLALEELVQSGISNCLYVKTAERTIDNEFRAGIIKTAKMVDVQCDFIEPEAVGINDLVNQIMGELETRTYPIGLLQPNAGLAYSLQREMLERGVRIPEDVSMVVIEKDIQQTHNLAPVPMTTVLLDDWLRGFVAGEMLHRLLQGNPSPYANVFIPPKGVKQRASTGHEITPDTMVSAALTFLRKNFLKPISVDDIVAHVNSSRRTVEMRFRAILNRGIHEELSRLRIEEAKRQIKDKKSSITMIAEACGFSSVHYFSAAFKRVTGVSPKAYQKEEL